MLVWFFLSFFIFYIYVVHKLDSLIIARERDSSGDRFILTLLMAIKATATHQSTHLSMQKPADGLAEEHPVPTEIEELSKRVSWSQ